MPSIRELAARLGIPKSTLHDRMKAAAQSPPPKGRIELEIDDGTIVIFSDAHWWPDQPLSTAYLALLQLIKKLKPAIIVANGDMTDMATVSRHPPLGWASMPTVADELKVCQERLGAVKKASPGSRLIWPIGNHDQRLECKLAQVAPELKNVYGTSLQDHFPDWEPCYSVFVNDDLVIKHRFKGGQHAPGNATLWAGRTVVTGHLHSQKVEPITDLNGTRWGCDTGALADVYGEQFSYMEDNPRSHRSGFAVITYVKGRLLTPELVRVVEPGLVEWRGSLIEV
jgi:hypothetical protein